jgi:hypothetical protein
MNAVTSLGAAAVPWSGRTMISWRTVGVVHCRANGCHIVSGVGRVAWVHCFMESSADVPAKKVTSSSIECIEGIAHRLCIGLLIGEKIAVDDVREPFAVALQAMDDPHLSRVVG